MVLVLFLLFLLFLIILILAFSTLKINIKELEISNEIDNESIIKSIKVCIGIYFLNKLKVLEKCINKSELEKISKSNNLQKIKDNFLKKEAKVEMKERSKHN